MTASSPEFSRPLSLTQVGEEPIVREISASQDECQALAARFELLSLGALRAHLTVGWIRGGKVVRVEGHFTAAVVQSCVATLEPVPADVEGEILLDFATGQKVEAEVVIETDGMEIPEPLESGALDLGEIVAQQLSLALDPYPRKPGIGLIDRKWPADSENGPVGEGDNPFAALRRLARKD